MGEPGLNDPPPRREAGPLASLWRELWSEDDTLAVYRDRIAGRLLTLASAVAAILLVYQLVNRRFLLAGLLSVVVLFVAWNARRLVRGGPPVVPYWLLIGVLMVSACFASYYQGFYGVFWSFPILFGAFFVLPRRVATAMGIGLTLTITVITAGVVSLPAAVRALTSLGLMVVMIAAVLSIITELQRALQEQAVTDPLTGAYNRRHLQNELARLVPPEPGSPFANSQHTLLAIDIDHFKRVNDVYGHAAGDAVLRRLVAAISARKRASDLLFRVGGEEFMLLLHRTTQEQGRAIAEDLRRRLQVQDWLPDGAPVTISVGVNEWQSWMSVDDWMRGADEALYEAKRDGRNRVVVSGSSPGEIE